MQMYTNDCFVLITVFSEPFLAAELAGSGMFLRSEMRKEKLYHQKVCMQIALHRPPPVIGSAVRRKGLVSMETCLCLKLAAEGKRAGVLWSLCKLIL